jgi:hypothetical protein
METRTARCHCGEIEICCSGSPHKISMCHCLDCQRRTGSAFSVAVFYECDQIRVERGMAATYERNSASGFPVRFRFCGRCGSNVYWEPRRLPHLIGVAIGAFADPLFRRPDQSVWRRAKHAWLTLPDGIVAYDVAPYHR